MNINTHDYGYEYEMIVNIVAELVVNYMKTTALDIDETHCKIEKDGAQEV